MVIFEIPSERLGLWIEFKKKLLLSDLASSLHDFDCLIELLEPVDHCCMYTRRWAAL